jgi:putative peptidoglycan lipid II flippase
VDALALKKTMIGIIGGVVVINMASRLLGFLRDMIIGYQYGTNATSDAIFAAYSLPYFLYIVIGGSLATAFISIYSKIDNLEDKEAFRNKTLLGTGIMMIFMSLCFAIFARPISMMLFYGMTGSSLNLTAKLLALMAPSIFFMVMSMVISGLLNVHGYYKLTAFSTLALNGCLVLIGWFFVRYYGPYAHGWAVLIGSLVMFALVVMPLIKEGNFRWQVRGNTKRYFIKLWKVFLPILLGGATIQFYTLVQRMVASGLPEGAISSLNYAMKLVQLPQTVIMAAITTVIYPKLAKEAAGKNLEKMASYYNNGLRLLLFGIIPVSLFILIFSKDFVRVVFEHGSFGQTSTKMTATVLTILALSMFFNAANIYVTRFYYAYEKSVLPVIYSIISVFGINLLVIFISMPTLGVYGIALGTMVSTVSNCLFLFMGTRSLLKVKVFGFINLKELIFFLALSALLIFYRYLFEIVKFPYLNLTLEVVYFIVVGFVLAFLCKIRESVWIVNRVKRMTTKMGGKGR